MSKLPQSNSNLLEDGVVANRNKFRAIIAQANRIKPLTESKAASGETTYSIGKKQGDYETTGKTSDLYSGHASGTVDKNGNLIGASAGVGAGTKKIGAKVSGSINLKTRDVSGDIDVNAGIAKAGVGLNTKDKSGHIGAGLDLKMMSFGAEMDGSEKDGLKTSVEGSIASFGFKDVTKSKGPVPNTSADSLTLTAGPEDVVNVTTRFDRVMAEEGHSLYDPEKTTVLSNTTTTEVTAFGERHYKEVEVATLQENGKVVREIVEKEASPEFEQAHQNVQGFVETLGGAGTIATGYRNQISRNLTGRFESLGKQAPTDRLINSAAEEYTRAYGTALRNLETGDVVAKAIENGIYDALTRQTEARLQKDEQAPLDTFDKARIDASISAEMETVPETLAKIEAAQAAMVPGTISQVPSKPDISAAESVNNVLNQGKYGGLISALKSANAPQAMLEDVARGSASQSSTAALHGAPSLGAAIMHGIEGRTMIGKPVQGDFSPHEVVAAERARIEYERSGDVVKATQSALDGIREAESYAGPSQEFSPGDQPFSAKDIKTHMDSIRDSVTVQNDKLAPPTNAEKASWVPEEPTAVSWSQMAAAPAPRPVRSLPKSQMQKDAERQAREMMGLEAPTRQKQKKKELEHGLGMITNVKDAKKAVKSVFGSRVNADAYLGLDSAIDGVGRIKSVLNGPELSTRQMAGTLKTTKQDGQKIGTAVGALVDRPTVDKLMRSPAYSNAFHPEHETVANTVRGYFKATTPATATVTTPDNDPALWSGVQRETEKRLAEQAKVDAATESANTKAYAETAAKTAQAENLSFTLSDLQPSKQSARAKATTLGGGALDLQLGGYGRSLLDGTVPEFETTPAAKTLRDIRKSQQAQAQLTASTLGKVTPAVTKAPASKARQGGGWQETGRGSGHDYSSSWGVDNSKGYTGTDKTAKGSVITGAGNLKQRLRGMAPTNDGSPGPNDKSRVICTELVRQGRMAPSLQRLDIAFTLKRLSPATVRGYHFWAVPYVRLMKRSRLATALIAPLAQWRAIEIAYQMGERAKPHWRGKLMRVMGEPLCWALGMVLGWIGYPDRFHPTLGTKMSRIL